MWLPLQPWFSHDIQLHSFHVSLCCCAFCIKQAYFDNLFRTSCQTSLRVLPCLEVWSRFKKLTHFSYLVERFFFFFWQLAIVWFSLWSFKNTRSTISHLAPLVKHVKLDILFDTVGVTWPSNLTLATPQGQTAMMFTIWHKQPIQGNLCQNMAL